MREFDQAFIEELLAESVDSLLVRGGNVLDPQKAGLGIFPGAFDPLHDGHRQMAELGAMRIPGEVAFELSIVNVDKPPLSPEVVVQRLRQFSQEHQVWITRAATFVEKARLFGPTTFIVGADTIARIADPQYYDNSPARRDDAIGSIGETGCHFLVFGRVIDNRFQSLEQMEMPPESSRYGTQRTAWNLSLSMSRFKARPK